MMLVSKDIALTRETGAGRFQVRVQAGEQEFFADEPVAFGGLSSGPGPFDLMCAALGACTTMTMRLYVEHKGWSVGRFGVRVTHHKGSPEARDIFERVLDLGNVSPEQRDRLIHIAERCPVHLLLERGANIATSLAQSELAAGVAEGLHAQLIEKLCDEAL